MASSSPPTDDYDPNHQPPSPPTTFSPTPAPSSSYTSRSRCHLVGYSNAPPSTPTHQMSFLRGPLLPSAMQPQARAAPDRPLRPLPAPPNRRRTTRTYGLGTSSSPSLPTTQPTYHLQSGPSYPSGLGPSWASPLYPPGAYSSAPRPKPIPGLVTQAPTSIRPGTIPLLPPTNFPLPIGSSQSPLTTKTASTISTTSPPQSANLTSPNRSPVPHGPRPRPLDPSPSPTRDARTHSTLMDPISSGTNSPPLTYSSLAPTEPPPGNFDDETSRNATNSARRAELPWAGISLSNEEIQSLDWVTTQSSPCRFITTATEQAIPPPLDTYYREDDQNEGLMPSSSWSLPYLSYPLGRGTRTLWNSEEFDTFYYNEETFGPENLGLYQGPRYPYPLPDQPPRQVRQHGQYHGPRWSHLYAGANDGAGGCNDIDVEPDPQEEAQRAAAELAGRKLQEIAELEKKLNDAEMEHCDHATKWGLPLRPSNKGKEPDRGRQPAQPPLPPNQYRPLWR
ncbi:uncharacterized protein ARMOST_06282 [Armillaria ostoyae]|uniref:Uncharacterized protein n=1 Tax=Armillaria ostoyae TaxID=47428 RepID=A0A284R2J5_ARMOS|nr:uncharacterized protein ARMOST_06282 [Armillaria ostoyae]